MSCRRAHVLFVFFIYYRWMMVSCRRAHVLFVFFIYCGWWCPVGGLMSYLCFLFTVDGGVLPDLNK